MVSAPKSVAYKHSQPPSGMAYGQRQSNTMTLCTRLNSQPGEPFHLGLDVN